MQPKKCLFSRFPPEEALFFLDSQHAGHCIVYLTPSTWSGVDLLTRGRLRLVIFDDVVRSHFWGNLPTMWYKFIRFSCWWSTSFPQRSKWKTHNAFSIHLHDWKRAFTQWTRMCLSWKLMYDKPYTLLNSNASPTQWALETANKIIESVEIFPDPGFQCHPANPRFLWVVLLWKWFQSEASALTSWVGEHPNISQISVQSSTVKPDETLRRWNFFAPHKTCVWAFFCAIQQSNNPQPCRKKKDHQRSAKIIKDLSYKFKSACCQQGGISIAPRKGTRGLPLLKMGWC